jgi:hypothetical protein
VPSADGRLIFASDLAGSAEAARAYGVSRSTLVRRIEAGTIVPLAKLDGTGYVFDGSTLPQPQEDK